MSGYFEKEEEVIPLFAEIQSVFIFGHTKEGVEYAKMLDDVKQIFYYSPYPIDNESLEILRALPNVQVYEKAMPVEHITSSDLVIAASEDDTINTGIIDKAAPTVPFIAAVRPYAGVNVTLGQRLRNQQGQVAAYSKTNKNLLKELGPIEEKEEKDLETLRAVFDLLEETGEDIGLSKEALDTVYKMSPEERQDLVERMIKNYSQNRPDFRFFYFKGNFERRQAEKLAAELEEKLKSEGLNQKVEVVEIENPYDVDTDEEIPKLFRKLQNLLFLHKGDAILTKDAYSFDTDTGLSRIVGLNSRKPLKYYLIGKEKHDHVYEIKSGSRIGHWDEKVIYFTWEQLKELAQIHHGNLWNIIPVETSSDFKRAIEDIGESYDYLITENAELDELEISLEDLERNGLYATEIDMIPLFEQPVLNAVVRSTDHYLYDFFKGYQDEATQKACDAQELILKECLDSFYPQENSFVSTYAEFDADKRVYHLEVIGDERHKRRARVKLENVPEDELWPAVRKLRSTIAFDKHYGLANLTDYAWRHLDELKGDINEEDIKRNRIFFGLDQNYEFLKERFCETLGDDYRNDMINKMNDEVVSSGLSPNDRSDDMIEMLVQKEVEEKIQEIEEKGIEVYLFP